MMASARAGTRSHHGSRRENVTLHASRYAAVLILLTLGASPLAPGVSTAASGQSIARDANAALNKLLGSNPAAKQLSEKAAGILVFPTMLKAGFMFGGQVGEGALLKKGGRVAGFYNSVSASYGLQAGAQVFGYALFFMSDSAIRDLDAAGGFEVGVGPSVVVVDAGMAKAMSTTTLRSGVYAFIFDQKGAMAGLGIQGSKITRVSK
jgi:lipid-binding SYLF domain-containing protein